MLGNRGRSAAFAASGLAAALVIVLLVADSFGARSDRVPAPAALDSLGSAVAAPSASPTPGLSEPAPGSGAPAVQNSSATPVWPAGVPRVGPGLEPSPERATFSEPGFGLEFDYPANWSIDWTPGGSYVALQNYTSGHGLDDPKRIKIEILYFARRMASYDSLDAYVEARDRSARDSVEFLSAEEIEVAAQPALRHVIASPQVPDGAVRVVFAVGDDLYLLLAYDGHSTYIEEFDRVLSSITIK